MNGTCRLCRFWNNIGTGYGECRRFPPHIHATGSIHGNFALTDGGDACGEFKMKDDAPPPARTVDWERWSHK